MDILQWPTLVLNKGWVPISTVTVQDAITMLCGEFRDAKGRKVGKAQVLDVETWQTYDWETHDGKLGWKDLPVKVGEPVLALCPRTAPHTGDHHCDPVSAHTQEPVKL